MSDAFDKLAVLDSFIEEVNSYLPEIETNLERLAQVPGDVDALEETYRRSHTIGGSASMMDFPGLAHVAHGMEDILGDVLDGMTSLDAPTIGLLQRSLDRVRRLLRGIHEGIDEDAIIAEDDEDYTRYRIALESAARLEQRPTGEQQRITQTLPPPDLSLPSLDEMLASFRSPSAASGTEIEWPEEVAPVSAISPSQPQLSLAQAASEKSEQPDALDILLAATSPQPAVLSPSQNEQGVLPHEGTASSSVEPVQAGIGAAWPAVPQNEVTSNQPVSPQPQVASDQRLAERVPANAALQPREPSFPAAYHKMHEETQVLELQAASFKNMLAQLRLAVSVIEAQRTEFRSFLDGSKDALERMEDWAGQAMGLNLRNSPEQVRRYLPLSVMWVANSKLKKILDLLNQITGGAVATEEQMRNALQELYTSIEASASAFQQMQVSMPLHAQEAGWTPWEVRVSHESAPLQERVTFERRGDPVSLRAELEAQVREELRREYEYRPLTLAARSELEQQIRREVLQELESKRQLQERLSGVERQETLQQIEARLRSEIEIQVRHEFLNQLTVRVIGEEAIQAALQSTSSPAQTEAQPSVPSTQESGEPALTRPAPATHSISPEPSSPPSSLLSSGTDFGEEAAEIFRLEAEEHLQTISMRVAALEKSPTDRDLIQSIRRPIHTLKGAAGMMGFRAIADLCHASEDLLDSVMEGTTVIEPAVLSVILDTAEALDLLITGGDAERTGEAMAQTLRTRYLELLGERRMRPEEDLEADLEVEEESLLDTSRVTGVLAEARASAVTSPHADLSVRVRLQKLDELVNLFGELLVNRSILEERVERLIQLVADVGVSSTRLRDVGQKLETRFEAATLPSGRSLQVVPGNGNQGGSYAIANNGGRNANDAGGAAHLTEFDELELDRYTEFHQLTRGLSEGVSDMGTLSNEMEALIRECQAIFAREGRLSTTFQDRLLKARLVPLSVMKPRLYRVARSVALKQHKEFEFIVEGEATEVDRTVSEEIAGPLLHLVRNAVNHAIETPEARIQKGKSPVGQIKLSASYEGNQVVITVRDDGTGIDPELVRNAAIARGLIKPDRVLSDQDIIGLIFQPGFTTAAVLSEESGRGVGLDVVRDSVARLKGTLEVESMPGRGTAFTMKFPTSLAIQGAMIVASGGQQFAIPMVVVEAIGRLDTFKRSTLGGRPAIIVQNELYPLASLAQFLGLTPGTMGERSQLLLVNAGGQKVALVVDAIRGRMDVVMKNLGPHLRHVRGVAGGTVLGNGRVVLILELTELLSIRPGIVGTVPAPMWREGVVLSQGAAQPTTTVAMPPERRGVTVFSPPTAPKAAPERGKYILIVDDSPSVRRVVGNMLKQHNWQVQLARDGVEALDMITNETPAAVLLDIEMPRMDGYELMATVRAQEQYRTLPIVVLTSRAATKHQQRAMQLGANAYVVKPYQDEDLINTLNTLVYGAATT